MAIKEIMLNENKAITVDSSAGWLLIYREQFGRDITPDLLPLLQSGMELAFGFLEGLGEEITKETVLKAFDQEKIDSVVMNLAGMECVTVFQIIWALTACHAERSGNEVLPYRKWVMEQGDIPLDIVIPEIVKLVAKSCISIKNLKSLQAMMKKLKTQLAQKKSLLEQSKED